MKIIVVTNTSWNIYNFRLPLLRHLKALGYTIEVIAPVDEYSELLKQEVTNLHSLKLSRKGKNPFKDFSFFWQLKRKYKELKPDLVMHYTIKPNIYGSLAAKWLGVPFINNVTGLGTVFLHKNISSFIAKQLYKLAFQKAGKVFFQNKDDKNLFIEKGLCPKKAADIIPGSGIDIQKFQQEKVKNHHPYTFAYVGRMLHDKGIIELISAIRNIKKEGVKHEFIFAGKIESETTLGIDLEQINSWEDEGLIDYQGMVSDMKGFLEKTDCVVLPSYREGTPKALLEAASMSLPLIATDVPGCREVVLDNQNGFLCEVKNINSLTEALKKIVSLPEEKALQLGINGRERVKKHFSQEIILERYQETISDLITN